MNGHQFDAFTVASIHLVQRRQAIGILGSAMCATSSQGVGSANKERLCGGIFADGLCTSFSACAPS